MPRPPGAPRTSPRRQTPPRAPVALQLEAFRPGLQAEAFDLTVHQGETVTIYGADATSLSGLLDLIAGFSPPMGGRVLVQGTDITSRPAGQRSVTLVSARDPLFPHLDVQSNIVFALRAQGQGNAEAVAGAGRMMSLLGLDGLGKATPRTLSPEHTLRAMLARALVTSPAVLLLDNPYAALDPQAARRMASLLSKLMRARDLSILQSVPNKEDALRAGGSIAFFQNQTLLQFGRAADLYDRPAGVEVATLFGEANSLTGQILDIGDDVARIQLACGGIVEATASENELTEGQACLVCIRPDRISPFFGTQSLGLEDEDTPPVRGTLTDTVHLGDHVRMRVRCPDGTEIELRRPPLQTQKLPRPGTPVQLAWPAGHATAFPLRPDLY
ncbi:ABC transporter spermidine/putrescine permease [Gluconobacter thailandicus F149-1 = NBRC 100600]|uniref:ABC transporter ATP-binding protein n=2 Tax=Gluconobacter thailandicus TaxID=257438 RepID=A0ABQ0IWX0_GLUTH|nr:ABC transporter ATP-binding protein [Gluconobacter thailandicus]GAC89367.1 ABC transporter ATP-binding protein [Gluconobacter thailandicus NBRC 3255]GAD26704.1 ABC transporter ATP-binding protein [Gluconobacter thailandicus NBRC 3257]GAN93867.1 ABC transporter spermidine/putrescine permease [Gluconobacter thailandicus F149-1 = NBRC 100600]GEL88587.1 ABC transporter ATP-binding protein [Gluconobacter thailandicus F149-1 = NBRC 100600]